MLGWERRDPTRSGIKGNQAFKCANHNDPRLTGLKVGAVPTPSTKQERTAMTQHLLSLSWVASEAVHNAGGEWGQVLKKIEAGVDTVRPIFGPVGGIGRRGRLRTRSNESWAPVSSNLTGQEKSAIREGVGVQVPHRAPKIDGMSPSGPRQRTLNPPFVSSNLTFPTNALVMEW